jgi:hypothetical protein
MLGGYILQDRVQQSYWNLQRGDAFLLDVMHEVHSLKILKGVHLRLFLFFSSRSRSVAFFSAASFFFLRSSARSAASRLLFSFSARL